MLAISELDRGDRVKAFSLLEVIVALGIFAGGILVLLACFPLTTKSFEAAGEIDAAAQTGEALLGYLRARPFAEVAAQLQTPAELSAFDERAERIPSGATLCFYASADFQRLGLFGDPVWAGHETERYFEIALVRNVGLSPSIRIRCATGSLSRFGRGGRSSNRSPVELWRVFPLLEWNRLKLASVSYCFCQAACADETTLACNGAFGPRSAGDFVPDS